MEPNDKKKLTKKDILIMSCSGGVILASILMALLTIFRNKTYTVKFESGCGQVVESQVVKANGKITEPTVSYLGYDLDGWYLNSDKWDFIADKVTEDITLYADWDVKEYTIDFDYDGGTALNKTTYTIEDEFDLHPASKTGNTFTGYKNEAGEIINKIEKGTTGDLSLKAEYNINQYTLSVTCKSSYGTVTGEGTYDFGSEIDLSIALNTNFEVANWTDADTLEEVSAEASFKYTMPARDVNLIINIKQESFNITYVDEHGADNSNPTTWMTHNELTLEPLECEYYEFLGWYDENDQDFSTFTQDEKKDITLYAKWANKKYDVTLLYDTELMTVEGDGLHEWGSEVTLKVTPKAHVSITSWKNGLTLENYGENCNEITITMPKENISIRVSSSVATYSVTFVDAYNNPNTDVYSYYSTYTLQEPTREGYEFLGWYDQSGNKVTEINNETESNIILTARWEIKYFTVTITSSESGLAYSGSGSYPAFSEVRLSVDDSALAANKVFAGWITNHYVLSLERNYTFVINSDMEITAYCASCGYTYVNESGNTITRLEYSSSDTLSSRTTETYNDYGLITYKLWEVISNNKTSRYNYYYTYDDNNQIIKEVTPYRTYTYAYDDEGRLITKTYSGTTINYEYDDNGELSQATYSDGLVYTYRVWTEDGIKYVEEKDNVERDDSYSYDFYYITGYDSEGRIVSYKPYYYYNETFYGCTTWYEKTYNSDGKIQTETGYSAETYVDTYYYNSNNQLAEITHYIIGYSNSQTHQYYFYDANNNMTYCTYVYYYPSGSSGDFGGTFYGNKTYYTFSD